MNDFEIAAAQGARHSPPPQRHALETTMAPGTFRIRASQIRTSRITCTALAALAVDECAGDRRCPVAAARPGAAGTGHGPHKH
jgi:hypothetical protein